MQLSSNTANRGMINRPVFPQSFSDVVVDELIIGKMVWLFGCWYWVVVG